MYSLVIFDCDGVLVDSEKLSAKVFSQVLAQAGIEMSAQKCFDELKGRTLADCYGYIEQAYQCALPAEFDDGLAKATLHAFEHQLKPIDAVEALIKALKLDGVKICVASNGGHEKIKRALSLTGLDVYFEGNIFSAQDVERGKPAPDLFLYAANKMHVHPDQCCVIEDSFTGVNAAIKANMDVIFFGEARHEQPSQAGFIQPTLNNNASPKKVLHATTMYECCALLKCTAINS